MTPVSIGLHEKTLEVLRQFPNPGNALNNILDEYKEPAQIAKAITRHLENPVVDPSPIKRTSLYMTDKWVKGLREFAAKTYLPFEALLRILVQDYLQRRHLIHIQHPTQK